MAASPQARRSNWPSKGAPYVWAILAVAVATAGSWALHSLIADESLSMVFLSAVVVSSVIYGRNAGIVAAVTAFLSYNVIILEPRFSFRFAPLSDTLTLAVFFAVALLTGGLAGRVRDQARAMADRASTMTMLFQTSQALAKPSERSELSPILASQIAAAIGTPTHLFIRSDDDITWVASGSGLQDSKIGAREPSMAVVKFAERTWTSIGAEDGLPIGRASPSDGLAAYPLGSINRPLGLLVCERPSAHGKHLMDEQTFGVIRDLAAIALERAYLMEEMTKTRVLAETDRLRIALLSSISHDFRTPLSGILASATALIEHRDRFPQQTIHDLLAEIRDQAERINRYVANLLDMIKLESGSITVKLEPTDPVEIIAAASRRCAGASVANGHGPAWLRQAYPSQPCLVEADPVLLEQALFNILENATLYSPPDSTVEISLHASLHLAEIVVADEGPGIASSDLERVFDKFFRVSDSANAVHGTGLGLPICRGLVEAMGGTVRAVSPIRDSHGTAIHICLRRAVEV